MSNLRREGGRVETLEKDDEQAEEDTTEMTTREEMKVGGARMETGETRA